MEEARQLLDDCGGKDNIAHWDACATKITIIVKDLSLVDQSSMRAVDDVQDLIITEKTLQVVLGAKTQDYAKHFTELLQSDSLPAVKIEIDEVMQRLLAVISDIFEPLVPYLILFGLSSSFVRIAESIPISVSWYQAILAFLLLLNQTMLLLIPVALSWALVKRFHGTELLGISFGLALILPAYVPELHFLNHYEGQMIPALAGAGVLVGLERISRRYLAAKWHSFVPLGSFIVTLALTQLLLGPIASDMNRGLALILRWFFTSEARFFIAPVIGFGYAYAIKYGCRSCLIPFDLIMIGEWHYTYLWPLLALTEVSQGMACYALALSLVDEKKEQVTSAARACLRGSSQSAILSYNWPLKDPFRYACIGSGAACLVASVFKIRSYSIGIGGLATIFSILIGVDWLVFILASVIAAAIPYYVATDTATRKELYQKLSNWLQSKRLWHKYSNDSLSLMMPVTGQITDLEENDSQGSGISIHTSSMEIIAPLAGPMTKMDDMPDTYLIRQDVTQLLVRIRCLDEKQDMLILKPLFHLDDEVEQGDALFQIESGQTDLAYTIDLIWLNQQSVYCPSLEQTLEAGQTFLLQLNEEQ